MPATTGPKMALRASWLLALLALAPGASASCPYNVTDEFGSINSMLNASCNCAEAAGFMDRDGFPACNEETALTGTCRCRCQPGFAMHRNYAYNADLGGYDETVLCEPCPDGFYNTGESDPYDCTQCPRGPGAATGLEGASSSAACSGCKAEYVEVEYAGGLQGCECNTEGGHYLQVVHQPPLFLSEWSCSLCDTGTWSRPSRLRFVPTTCENCPTPFSQTVVNVGTVDPAECTCASGFTLTLTGGPLDLWEGWECLCPAGREPVFDDNLDANVCEPCGVGSFKNETSDEPCEECGLYYFAPVGSTQRSACVCPLRMVPIWGSGGDPECACRAGYELVCPDGEDCASTSFLDQRSVRNSLCQPCASGTFKKDIGNHACDACALGSSSAEAATAASECSCPDDAAVSEDGGQGAVCECEKGYFVDGGDLADGGRCTACAENEYKPTQANSNCRLCPGGLITTSSGAAAKDECTCDAGQYRVVVDWEADEVWCEDCPPGLICKQGTNGPADMGVSPGFWRYSAESLVVYACASLPSACPGGAAFSASGAGGDDLCADGHVGPRCEACAIGYGRDALGECEACPLSGTADLSAAREAARQEDVFIVASAAVLLFVGVGAATYVVLLAGRSGAFDEDAANDLMPLVKMSINWLQMTSFAAAFDLHWSDSIRHVLRAMRQVSMPISLQLAAVECELGASDDRQWTKLVLYVVIVPICACVWAAVWAVLCLVALARHRAYGRAGGGGGGARLETSADAGGASGDVRRRSSADSRRLSVMRAAPLEEDEAQVRARIVLGHVDGFKVALLVFLFVVHMPLAEETLVFLACEPFEDAGGVTYLHLSERPSVRCDLEPHASRQWFAAIFFVLFGAGIPLGGTWLLWSNRRKIATRDEQFVSVYGFLFRGFEQRGIAVFWEVAVIMPRKVALALVRALLSRVSVFVQVLVALYLLFGMVLLHVRYRPYVNPALDQIETLSLVVTFSTVFAGMFLLVNEAVLGAQPAVVTAVTAVVLIMQGAMALVIGTAFVTVVLPQQKAKLDKLRARVMGRNGDKLAAGGAAAATDAPAPVVPPREIGVTRGLGEHAAPGGGGSTRGSLWG